MDYQEKLVEQLEKFQHLISVLDLSYRIAVGVAQYAIEFTQYGKDMQNFDASSNNEHYISLF